MIDVAIIYAVFRRLTGAPLDSQGNPLIDADTGLPVNRERSWGFRIPLIRDGQGQRQLARGNPDGVRVGERGYHKDTFRQVPVYMQGIEAVQWKDIFPCVSFTISDVQEGGNPYIWSPADGIDGVGSRTGTQTITNQATGETYEVPDEVTTRAHPEPWDFLVTINLYSRDPIELAAMNSVMRSLFKAKDAIDVEMLDGSFVRLDMMFDRYAIMDQGEPYDPQRGIGSTQDAYLHHAYTYKIEGNQDNTSPNYGFDEFTTEQTVLERLLELRSINDRVLRQIRLENLTP